jgi:hypothetical protein
MRPPPYDPDAIILFVALASAFGAGLVVFNALYATWGVASP